MFVKTKRKDRKNARKLRRRNGKSWCLVYILKADAASSPVYVGQTRTLPDIRLAYHIEKLNCKMRNYQRLSPVEAWIANIIGSGRKPIIEVIDREGIWDISEAVWIDRLRSQGNALLNVLSVVA